MFGPEQDPDRAQAMAEAAKAHMDKDSELYSQQQELLTAADNLGFTDRSEEQATSMREEAAQLEYDMLAEQTEADDAAERAGQEYDQNQG